MDKWKDWMVIAYQRHYLHHHVDNMIHGEYYNIIFL